MPPTQKTELEHLKNIIGAKALTQLKRGNAVLQIWRNSTPHNWWVEGKGGQTYWHSADDMPRPSLSLFVKLNDSDERVVRYWGADSGQPCLSTYALKESKTS